MRYIYCILLCGLLVTNAYSQEFDKFFLNKTLRVDYLFTGDAQQQTIVVDELSQLPTWAGRRFRLNRLPLEGNGQIAMKDHETQQCIYKTSFSSLFQEWLTTEEARTTPKGFENTFLLPFPKHTVEIEVTLYDMKRNKVASLKHIVDPQDILIHKRGQEATPYSYLHKGGTPEQCIDVVIMAEGYTEKEKETFYRDAQKACNSLFAHEPFASMKNRFNIIAVESWSEESGVSVPREGKWRHTAVHSHFDTFYSERYLTTSRVKSIHNLLAGIPYEHIIILANTDVYGGGGIYNSYTLTTAHHPQFEPVVVHEFGHSFGGLADEYFYENDVMTDTYHTEVEPWEQNVTSMVDFDSKWADMLKPATPIPTPAEKKEQYSVGVYEGAAYSAKGLYRGAYDCRMKTNSCKAFCPVCQRALSRIIDFYTKE